MDARTRPYPPLPARPKVRVVVPLQGDLRVRPLIPLLFLQQLHIHCPPAHRHVYRRFRVTRKFIVMAKSGDMFTKTTTLEVRMDDLPNKAVLPLPPPLAMGAIVKVLDLVQCYTYANDQATTIVPNIRWELVRVRWKESTRETWIPIELLGGQSPALLQEFYVNSINSWGFHGRVFPESWTRFRTEIELWLHHPEFQAFYNQLRRRLARQTSESASSVQAATSHDVKDRRLTAEAARAHATPSAPAPPARPQPSNQPVAQPSTVMCPRQTAQRYVGSQPLPAQSSSTSQSVPAPSAESSRQLPHREARPTTFASNEPEPPQITPNEPQPMSLSERIQAFVPRQTMPPQQVNRPEPMPARMRLHVYQPNLATPTTQQQQRPEQHPSRIAQSQHATPFPQPQRPMPTADAIRMAQLTPQLPLPPPVEPAQSANESRIPQHSVVQLSQIPPHPPTPPRPTQERPMEMQRPLSVPALSLPMRTDPPRRPSSEMHRSQTPPPSQPMTETPMNNTAEPERQPKEKKRDKGTHSSERDRSSPARSINNDEKKKKKKKKDKEKRLSQVEESTPRREKEREEKIKKKKRRDLSPETPRSKQRKLKRLKWSQAASESDESDDLLELTLRENGESDKQRRKRLKRLRNAADQPKAAQKEAPIIVILDSDEEDGDNTADKQTSPKKASKKKKKDKKDKEKKKKKRDRTPEESQPPEVNEEVAVEIDVNAFSESEEDDDEGPSAQSMLLGEIHCVCGMKIVGRYTGQWLQCWKEDCAVWQHAECVGYLLRRDDSTVLPEKYCCSTCDPGAFEKRYSEAKTNMREWLSICCESRNQKQLLKLLEDEEHRDAAAVGELVASTTGAKRKTLLMEAAEHGLTHTVRRLVRRYKVNTFATDSHSRNALHYAVIGESSAVVTFLMNHSPRLVRHQDLRGQMPLHIMLMSCHLNSFGLPLLQKDPAMCVTSDFDGNMPIHFACQAVNTYTVENVRQILSVQPLLGVEKSPERLTPLLYLCRASASIPSSNTDNLVQKANCIAELIDEILDVDVLGEFLNARDPRGWTPLHFVAEAGNHMLLQVLCHRDEVEIDAITFDSGETALHLAARANHVRCVEILLTNRRQRLDVAAVDGSRWIPVLRTTAAACLEQLLCYDLEKQLLFIGNLARGYRHQDILRRWMYRVLSEPTCHSIVNDWLQYNIPLLDELEEFTFLHRSFVRVDCKLDYLYEHVFASIKRQSQRRSTVSSAPDSDSRSLTDVGTSTDITLSSSSGECYWKQFVAQAHPLDAFVFRQQLRITIARGENLRLDNLTLVLVRLLAGLLQPTTGLFVRNTVDSTIAPSPHRLADDPETLREYFVLGEFVAYLVLQEVSVGEVFEFSTSFLAAVVGQPAEPMNELGAFTIGVFAESFAAGFDAVLPATVRWLHPEELQIVLNGRSYSLNTEALDWRAALQWHGFESGGEGNDQEMEIAQWWRRMTRELVEDERLAFVLWLTGSFLHTQRVFFASDETDANQPKVRVERYQESAEKENSSATVDEDALVPTLDPTTRTLVLPLYSTYERFRSGVLSAFRHADEYVVPV